MFQLDAKITNAISQLEKVEKAQRPLTVKRVAAYVRRVAINSMERTPGPSKPGTPPHTHKGRLRRSIFFAVDDNGVADVGPSWSGLQRGGLPPYVGRIHEYGGKVPTKRRKGATVRKYPARPFMRPALDQCRGEILDAFKAAMGG